MSAEHAGICTAVGSHAMRYTAAFDKPDALVGGRGRYPDSPQGIETNSVRNGVVWHLRPDSPIVQVALFVDIKSGQSASKSLTHDQGVPIWADNGSIRENQVLRHDARCAVGSDGDQLGDPLCGALVQIEAKITDIRLACCVHDHVVTVTAGQCVKIRVGGQIASIEAQDAFVLHRDYQQVASWQPTESRRAIGHLNDGLGDARVIQFDDFVIVHVR